MKYAVPIEHQAKHHMRSLSHMYQRIVGVWGSTALRMQKAIKMALNFLNQNITLQQERGHIVNLLREWEKAPHAS